MYLRESASRAFTLLAKNPPLFGRTMLAKANSLRRAPAFPAQRQIGDVVFEIGATCNPAPAAMYFASYSPLVVDAMKRHLTAGDVFIDVGANVGYLSAVGASLVGRRGQVHSFEPVPRYFQILRRLAELNPSHAIVANSCAAGAVNGTAKIHVTREPGQNTLVRGYKSGAEITSSLDISVIRLDSYIESQRLSRVALIKIDTEGFELPVLEGLRGYFDSGQRPAIICEIAPRAYALMGRTSADISDYMARYGYRARDIIDGTTPVNVVVLQHVTDVLFLKGS
ncbi:MAG: FkbM family methyltransferase [Candidatus Acidiferrales bacterium]